jgi:hypothetical protein
MAVRAAASSGVACDGRLAVASDRENLVEEVLPDDPVFDNDDLGGARSGDVGEDSAVLRREPLRDRNGERKHGRKAPHGFVTVACALENHFSTRGSFP